MRNIPPATVVNRSATPSPSAPLTSASLTGAGLQTCAQHSCRPWPLSPPPPDQLNALSCRGGPMCPPPGLPHRPLRGACRQACHAGLCVEHAVLRATPAVLPVVGFSGLWLRCCGAITFGVGRHSCGAGFLACGRLSSRPGCPLPTTLFSAQSRPLPWSKPPGLPCRRSRRQSNTHLTCTGLPNAIRPARLRAPPQPAASRRCRPACPPPLFPSPCPPCSLYY